MNDIQPNNSILETDLKSEKKVSLLFILLSAVVVIAGLIFIFKNSNLPVNSGEVSVAKIEKSKLPFENLDLESKAVVVWDVKNQKEIYARNPETQLPLASLTKVMMALVALNSVPEGTIITINNEDLIAEGDSGLRTKERWSLGDLIDFSLVVSSNDGALAVANAVGSVLDKEIGGENYFIKMMNEKARELKMSQTYFVSSSGLDKDDIIPGGNGSARDMAILFEHFLKKFPHALEATSYDKIILNSLDSSYKAKNTNALTEKLPGLIASKTGFTDLAGGNLVIVFEPEPMRPIILVSLGSTQEGRFSDIEKLYLTTLDYIN
jgi:serine-type D-Ala-D-Ala carboxypeptidase (penicillin-binding protein 5/6)